jgi:hypothetical protein
MLPGASVQRVEFATQAPASPSIAQHPVARPCADAQDERRRPVGHYDRLLHP